MILSHKIALDPTFKQANALARACGVARFTWNWGLAEWKRRYEAGEKPTASKLKLEWNKIKGEQFPWVKESPKGANQQPFVNLGIAFSKFFKKAAKYPQFKRKGQHDSFYVENDKLKLIDKAIRLPVIGSVRMHESLRFEGRVMAATVSRIAGKWFIALQVDLTSSLLPRTGNEQVGVDLGLSAFATFSTSEKVLAPKPLKVHLKKLKLAQRQLSRKMKGSARRKKAAQLVARLHYRVACVRGDFLHKLSTRVCRENQTVVIEDLCVKNMVKNHKLARSISDAGWSEFRRQIEYKSLMYETDLRVVDRFFPSFKTCHRCGQANPYLRLSDRIFKCGCGYTEDRDINAAKNLRTAGLAGTWLSKRQPNARGPEGSGLEKRQVKPRRVETRTLTWDKLISSLS